MFARQLLKRKSPSPRRGVDAANDPRSAAATRHTKPQQADKTATDRPTAIRRRGDLKGNDCDLSADALTNRVSGCISGIRCLLVIVETVATATQLSGDPFSGSVRKRGHEVTVLDISVDVDVTKKQRLEGMSTAKSPSVVHRIDGSDQWRDKFHSSCVPAASIPSIKEVERLLLSPLPVKIGLTPKMMARVRSQAGDHRCNELFVEDKETPCYALWEDEILRVLKPTQLRSRLWDSDCGFQRAWGVIVRELLAAVFIHKRTFTPRKLNDKHATDFTFEIHNVGVFHSEEEVPTLLDDSIDDSIEWVDNMDAPRRRLQEQLRWSWGMDVPYVIGYAASGYKCELHAMHTKDMMDVQMTNLGTYDTRDAKGRFEFVLALLQLCRLFSAIAERSSKRLEWADVTQPDGVEVTLRPTSVVRDYTKVKRSYRGVPFKQCLAKNKKFRVIKLQLSHTEELKSVSSCGLQFTFSPRGFAVLPQSLDELFHAIECVLTALVELHEMGWMHRNISWSNVLQYRDASCGWFLTDFVHAARSPQDNSSGVCLDGAENAPELSQRGRRHTEAVDLYSVGWLLSVWKAPPGSTVLWKSDKVRLKLMRDLLEDDPTKRPTATDALTKIKEIHATYRETRSSSNLLA